MVQEKTLPPTSPRAGRSTSALAIRGSRLYLTALGLSLFPGFQIPPSAWETMLQRVEQGKLLRQVAHDYGVSNEARRRVLRTARRRYV